MSVRSIDLCLGNCIFGLLLVQVEGKFQAAWSQFSAAITIDSGQISLKNNTRLEMIYSRKKDLELSIGS